MLLQSREDHGCRSSDLDFSDFLAVQRTTKWVISLAFSQGKFGCASSKSAA
jgi:hypothetical protein